MEALELLIYCQVAVARHGRLAATRSFGHSSNGPVTDETLFHIFSSTKAVTGVAIAQLIEQGKLTLDTLVEEIIPGFGVHGKAGTTIRHLVTFTAGFPTPEANSTPTTTELLGTGRDTCCLLLGRDTCCEAAKATVLRCCCAVHR